MRIAWAVAADFAATDADLPLLAAAATERGVRAETAVWDDPDVDWDAFDLVVVRSCWDYVPRRDAFLAWAERVPRLANPAPVLRWNTDKTYLRELASAGVGVVPTAWSATSRDELPAASEWVVKPTISAGAADTARWDDPDQALEHGARLLAAGRPTMTQPYVDAVDRDGETGLLFFGGTFSHAFRKGALLAPGGVPRADPEMQEDVGPRDAGPDEVAFAEQVVATAHELLGTELLYARVDVVRDADGTPLLMELELTEPSFFLEHTSTGADAFLDAVLGAVRT
jgi:glutathione synthase/RimK-type ligase-like ATP-grasp enzyme